MMTNVAYTPTTQSHRKIRTTPPLVRRITLSDRVYVKLVLNGLTIFEAVRDDIADFTSLLLMLRTAARRYKGLAKMVVRNISQGWAVQRPFMLVPAEDVKEPISPGHYPMPWQTH